MANVIKTDRIDLRINKEDKAKLEKAAQINHLSVESYITSIALKQADFDIQQNEVLYLNEADANLVMELLDDSGEPNINLINLFKS